MFWHPGSYYNSLQLWDSLYTFVIITPWKWHLDAKTRRRLYTFVIITPWKWHLDAETRSRFLYMCYMCCIIKCICWSFSEPTCLIFNSTDLPSLSICTKSCLSSRFSNYYISTHYHDWLNYSQCITWITVNDVSAIWE